MAEAKKQKILYIARFLMEKTDEEHPATMEDIITMLAGHEIKAVRQTIYGDLDSLREFGMDIRMNTERKTGYYVANRSFDLGELKLLVDCIQSSKFITVRKTSTLISKLEKLCNEYDAARLQRQVFIRNRIKNMDDTIFSNADRISDAISDNCSISFRYFNYDMYKNRVFRRGGEYYSVSPYALIIDDEFYYLLAWDEQDAQFKHFRVDKMLDIRVNKNARKGYKEFEKIDLSSYTKKIFGMFGGEPVTVRIRFASYLAGAVIDVLGSDVFIVPDGESGETFTATAEVVPSSHFLGWIFALGQAAEIVYPQELRNEMKTMLEKMAERYR